MEREGFMGKNNVTAIDLSEERLKALIERMPAGIVVLDGNGNIVEYNPTAHRLLGDPLLNERWCDVIEREIIADCCIGDTLKLQKGRIVNIATQSLGKVPGQLILLHDVTQEQQLQERLNHYQRLSSMGKMAAQLAHQIRTPLSTALLYASHLGDPDFYRQQDDNIQHQVMKVAKKITGRLQAIESHVSEMLIFAKGGSVIFETVSLAMLFADIQQTMEPRVQANEAMLIIDNGCTGRKLRCNGQMLAGAIENCINNALEASPMGCNITINLSEIAADKLQIVILDEGPGMSEDMLSKVTEPFFTTRSKGTGLGLAVAKMVADTHGGEFLLASEQGKGTTVTFTLPMIKESIHE